MATGIPRHLPSQGAVERGESVVALDDPAAQVPFQLFEDRPELRKTEKPLEILKTQASIRQPHQKESRALSRARLADETQFGLSGGSDRTTRRGAAAITAARIPCRIQGDILE